MKNITVILPIHKLDKQYKKLLTNSIDSVKVFYNDVKLMIVAPSFLKDELTKIEFGSKLEVDIKFHNTEYDFCSQINYGAKSCDTEWFSILEVDDVYKKHWLKTFKQYQESYPDFDVFLPIVSDVSSDQTFLNYMNDSVWAYGFSAQQGILDNDTLFEYQNYQISGGIYRTNMFLENGGLKNNIKLTFGYEFLLRLTHNGVKVMVLPKNCYQHTNLREDSIFYNYKNSETEKLSEEEVSFWLETAKKEFFFKNKRDVKFSTV